VAQLGERIVDDLPPPLQPLDQRHADLLPGLEIFRSNVVVGCIEDDRDVAQRQAGLAALDDEGDSLAIGPAIDRNAVLQIAAADQAAQFVVPQRQLRHDEHLRNIAQRQRAIHLRARPVTAGVVKPHHVRRFNRTVFAIRHLSPSTARHDRESGLGSSSERAPINENVHASGGLTVLRCACPFGKPVSTPDQVRGRLFPGHALDRSACKRTGHRFGEPATGFWAGTGRSVSNLRLNGVIQKK
jgi:hypothetical protein